MDLKRGFLRSAVSRLQEERRLSPAWQVDQAVAVLDSLLSVDTYQRLVTERGWHEETLVQKVKELCLSSFVVEPRRKPQRNSA